MPKADVAIILKPKGHRQGGVRWRSCRPRHDIEKEALSVASYGKQLGRISDALIVLLKHVEFVGTLSAVERDAIRDVKSMLNEIANRKNA
jgi:hypothetical protein